MSVITPPLPAAVPPEPVARISVSQFHAMVRSGAFDEDDPLELLEGWLFKKMPKNPPHRVATRAARKALEKVLPPEWEVESQEPITTDDSEPEPDISVIRAGALENGLRHPTPEETGMVIEVSDTTLARDRGLKKRVFARARIPVYWIVNVVDRQVEVYTDPTGPADEPDYRPAQIFKPGELVPVVLDGKEIARLEVTQLLP
jgi:Uma2 family endonuclease